MRSKQHTSQWSRKQKAPTHCHRAWRSRSRAHRMLDKQNKSQPWLGPLSGWACQLWAIHTPLLMGRHMLGLCCTWWSLRWEPIWLWRSHKSSKQHCHTQLQPRMKSDSPYEFQNGFNNANNEEKTIQQIKFYKIRKSKERIDRKRMWKVKKGRKMEHTRDCASAPAGNRAVWGENHRNHWAIHPGEGHNQRNSPQISKLRPPFCYRRAFLYRTLCFWKMRECLDLSFWTWWKTGKWAVRVWNFGRRGLYLLPIPN